MAFRRKKAAPVPADEPLDVMAKDLEIDRLIAQAEEFNEKLRETLTRMKTLREIREGGRHDT